MSEPPQPVASSRYLVGAAAVVVVVAGMKAAQELLVPLVFAAFLTILMAPLVSSLRSRGAPDLLSIPLVVIALVSLLATIGAIVGGSLNLFVAAVPRYQAKLNAWQTSLDNSLAAYGIPLHSLFGVEPGQVIQLAGQTLSQAAAALSDALLIVLVVAFMLFEISSLKRKLQESRGAAAAELTGLAQVSKDVNQYVLIKTYVSVATGLVIGLFLFFLGVDFPVLWGLVAFLLNYIPNIGSIIAAIPPVLLSLVQFGVGRAVLTLSGFVVVNLVIGNVIEPRMMGRRLGLSTLVVFLSLIFWGWLWGPLGMLLSVPLTMIAKILLEHTGRFPTLVTLLDSPAPTIRPPPAK